MHNVNDYYSVVEAAKYMNVSRPMMYHWVYRGLIEFRVHSVTKKKYFLKKDLDKLKNMLLRDF